MSTIEAKEEGTATASKDPVAKRKPTARRASSVVAKSTAKPLDDTLTTLNATMSALTETVDRLCSAALTKKAPPSVSASEGEPARVEETTLGRLLSQYGVYLALFVGSGLISGSVVHFPLSPSRYLIIGVLGAVLFSGASLLSDFRKQRRTSREVLRLVVSSLVLALGIGMVSGGIQHFGDFPGRAAKLIPLGIFLSLGSFIVRDGHRLAVDRRLWLLAGGLWVLGSLTVGLHVVAGNMEPAAAHHGHAEVTEVLPIAESNTVPEASSGAKPESHGH